MKALFYCINFIIQYSISTRQIPFYYLNYEAMSNILQEEDNITILGDLYNYPVYHKEKVAEDREAILLQIIIVVNGKQKIFRTNYDIDRENKRLKDYSAWNDLTSFMFCI